ncbi:hypothetical protein [Nocardioides jejuensis]|uniref:DUF559 domain-containing protein n=1 Tax=Nocardioides jejuensis TaxID=2502782 RepID=A0A4R1CFY9_9ACTN|nr:hypothetical protein [Nocardioides jejuensis]TCJ30243.1 hypothetical protein EPD65_04995 [Nocardioides jejuensis]
MDRVGLVDVIRRLGWSASWAELRSVATERAIRSAVADGVIVRAARGRYVLPDGVGPGQSAALRVNGTVSHLSAALRWGMAVRSPPPLPTVTVPRGRSLGSRRRAGVQVFWADLTADEVELGATTPVRTVLDCAARLPEPEALVVADSALRMRLVSRGELERRAVLVPLQVRERVVRVVDLADDRPQSAFESLVRGQALGVPRLSLVPQVLVGSVHPDLWDERLRLAVECDSYEWHAKRADLISDCERYNDFALEDVMLVRFAWEHSMNQPGYVATTLGRAVTVRERQLRLC